MEYLLLCFASHDYTTYWTGSILLLEEGVGQKIDRKACPQLCEKSGGLGFKLFLTDVESTSKIYDAILIGGIIFYLIKVKIHCTKSEVFH